MPFLWHPFLYHYGSNWHVPAGGAYSVAVHIDPPSFFRHDPTNGRRYTRAIDVVFEGITIEPGVKHSRDASPRTGPSGPVS
jgi:hypothetical protein